MKQKKKNDDKCLLLLGLNTRVPVEIRIEQEVTLIGSSKKVSDVVLSFNPLISRMHIKIRREGARYFLTDLNSKNGTYLNGLHLEPMKEVEIKNQDVIRMADTSIRALFTSSDTPRILIRFTMQEETYDMEIPRSITAFELSEALYEIFHLEKPEENEGCRMIVENPFLLLQGDQSISKMGVHNGSRISYVKGQYGR